MNLRQIKTKTFVDVDVDALDAQIAAWIDTVPDAEFVGIVFSISSGEYGCQITYTL